MKQADQPAGAAIFSMKHVVLTLALAVGACAPSSEPVPPATAQTVGTQVTAPEPPFSYDWSRPSATFTLDKRLTEISGLTMLPDGRFAAVQDEDGIVYTLDPATGEIAEERPFRGPGDYEGVEATPHALWVLRSNGTLHELRDGTAGAVEHDTPLKGKCDAEGLGYDHRNGRLLIACKEDPGASLDDVKAVYAFSLGTKTLAAQPAFVLSKEALDGEEKFKPSALAVHPSSGQIYVLSSVRKAVAVLSVTGALETVIALDPSQHEQPEGLAFAPDGTLYLSNEGGDGTATLMRFDPTR